MNFYRERKYRIAGYFGGH